MTLQQDFLVLTSVLSILFLTVGGVVRCDESLGRKEKKEKRTLVKKSPIIQFFFLQVEIID